MRTRTIVVLIALGAALLLREVLAGDDGDQVVAANSSPSVPAQAAPAPRRSTTTITTVETTTTAPESTTTTTAAPEEGFHDDAGEAQEAIEGYWESLPDPANSDLPPEVFDEVTTIGREVVAADVTGEGRDKYPEFFGGSPGKSWFKDFVIHTAGARSTGGGTDQAAVTVVWSAQPIAGGPPFDHHTSVVHVVVRDGRWVPEKLLS